MTHKCRYLEILNSYKVDVNFDDHIYSVCLERNGTILDIPQVLKAS